MKSILRPHRAIANAAISLAVDRLGRIVSLRNLATGTELIGRPEVSAAWRSVRSFPPTVRIPAHREAVLLALAR
jgi:hypothetical protein